MKFEEEIKNPNLTPKYHKACKLNPEQANSLQDQINDWLAAGVIEQVEQLSYCNWVCAIVPVLKP